MRSHTHVDIVMFQGSKAVWSYVVVRGHSGEDVVAIKAIFCTKLTAYWWIFHKMLLAIIFPAAITSSGIPPLPRTVASVLVCQSLRNCGR